MKLPAAMVLLLATYTYVNRRSIEAGCGRIIMMSGNFIAHSH